MITGAAHEVFETLLAPDTRKTNVARIIIEQDLQGAVKRARAKIRETCGVFRRRKDGLLREGHFGVFRPIKGQLLKPR